MGGIRTPLHKLTSRASEGSVLIVFPTLNCSVGELKVDVELVIDLFV